MAAYTPSPRFIELARRLKVAGPTWDPAPGDRFVVPVPDLVTEVFYLSQVTADVYDFRDGQVIGFNGTTEWALDSIDAADVVWLPREEQLRDALGDEFHALERVVATGGYVVRLAGRAPIGSELDDDAEMSAGSVSAGSVSAGSVSAEEAYAVALLGILTG